MNNGHLGYSYFKVISIAATAAAGRFITFPLISYSVGLNTFRKIAQDAGALYHLGKTVLVNTELVDEYLEHFRDEY